MIWAFLVLIAVSLILSAFISGSETAYLSVDRFRLRNRVSQNNRAARRVYRIISKPDDFFSTILLLNNLVNILIATLAGALVGQFFGADAAVTVILSTIATTIAVVIFSEITPKTIAAAIPERWSFATSLIVQTLITYTRPVTAVVAFIPRNVLRMLGINDVPATSPITPAELRMLIQIGEQDGTVEDRQGEMLENIFRFGEKNAADVMTPRPEIEWVYANETLGQFLEHYSRGSHTRFPVLDPEKDDVVGIVSAKRVLHTIAKRGYNLKTSIASLMTEPIFVNEARPLWNLFTLMRYSGHRLVLVMDEYGSVSGLVTITRLVEQVVGDTGEEGRQPKDQFTVLREGVFLVDAGMSVEDARDQLELDVPPGDYETMGGWFLALLGRIPSESEEGEQVASNGTSLKIARMDGNRIQRLLVSKEPIAETLDNE